MKIIKRLCKHALVMFFFFFFKKIVLDYFIWRNYNLYSLLTHPHRNLAAGANANMPTMFSPGVQPAVSEPPGCPPVCILQC